MFGRRSGVVIDYDAVTKDADGFDDVDAFWSAATSARSWVYAGPASSPAAPRSSRSARSFRSARSSGSRGSAARYSSEGLAEAGYGGGSPGGYDDDDLEAPAFGDLSDGGGEEAYVGEAREGRGSREWSPAAVVDGGEAAAAEEEEEEEEEAAAAARERVRPYEPPAPVVDEDPNLRRSKRAKFPVMKFWKNERLVYERDSVVPAPRVVAVQLGAPTPKPTRRPARQKASGAARGGYGAPPASAGGPLAPSDFEGDEEGEHCDVWDEGSEAVATTRTVARLDNLVMCKLPSAGGGVRALGASGFRREATSTEDEIFPGWVSGCLELPPRAVKDPESTGTASTVIFSCFGQDKALEVAYNRPDPDDEVGIFDAPNAQRFLLSPGDHFHVPPNNIYRVENRSTTAPAKLFFTMIASVARDALDAAPPPGGDDDDSRSSS